MSDFVFNVKGLTAQDRAQWEKDNIEELNKLGYTNWDDNRKDRYFRNNSFKNKFGNREDYNILKGMSPEKRDSIYLSSSDDDIENLQVYQNTKQAYEEEYNTSVANNGTLIGNTRRQWEDFDKMLDEVSPYYKRFKGTEYFPLDGNKKVELMSIYQTESEAFGPETAARKMAARIQDEVSENQPLADKIWNGIVGMGANIAGGTISFVGNITGGLSALTGLDRLLGENQKEGYLDNLWSQFIDNPWTRYGDQVMKQGTMLTEDDPEKAYNRLEVIRTTEEQENLWDNIFSVNTIPELMQQSGFTVASMLEGYGLTAIGNKVFNTMKYATMGSKLAATAEIASNVNKALQGINTWQRRYNAYIVPALVGQGEGALNALNTKQDYLEDAKKMIQEEQAERMEAEVQKRMQGIEIPKDFIKNGQEGLFLKQIEASIRNQVFDEYQPMYEDALKRAEEDADKAALTNFTINSFINGAANMTLKATMFNGKTREALSRSKVGKLFAGNRYSLDNTGNVVARELTKKQMAWNMAKEMLGEGLEEYSQDVSDAFSRGAAENDLANYIAQRYDGVADDAIVDSMSNNLGAAFAAAGRKAISKDAIQSGIYGALGQAMGTPNINAWLSKGDRVSLEGKSTLGKVGAIARNFWRNPFIESYYNDKQENQDRRESAKALNEWLAQGNNRERLTSLRGSLGWARSMQQASDEGDEFNYRNSRLGKQVQDYFMLEQLKGTPLYDAYMQRYMDILNAQEGDEMAQQIAQYDDRPLEEIKKDAQAMLTTMEKVQEATADLEKSLGNSIPQETKEALIYGKLSMNDWRERATQLENELLASYGGDIATTLTDEQKKYIARHGSISEPTAFDKDIETYQTKISNLEKNKSILSDKQKNELSVLNKQLKTLQDSKKKAMEAYKRLSKGLEETTPILSGADIMNLNPVDRYRMLNPENRSKYSQEQQDVIAGLVEKGTAATSDFMNKVEDAARINDAQMTFLGQYNAALKNPNILSNIENRLRLTKRLEGAEKSYKKLNEIQDYSAFAEAVDNALYEADDYEAAVLDQNLKDNPLYQRYKKDDEVAEGIYNQLLKNEAFNDISEQDKDLVAAMTKFLSRRGIDISNYDNAVAALTSADDSGKSNLVTWIEALNQKLPDNMKISLENIGTVVNSYKRALESYKKNEEVKEEVTKKAEEKPVAADKPAPLTGIFASKDATTNLEESGKQIAAEKEAEKAPETVTTPIQPSETEGVTMLSDDFINNNDEEVLIAAEQAINAVRNASAIYDEDAKQAAIDAINKLGSKHYNSIEELQEAIVKEAVKLLGSTTQGGDISERSGSLLQQASHVIKVEKKEAEKVTSPTEVPQHKPTISLARINSNLSGFLSKKFREWKVDEYLRSGKLSRKSGNMSVIFYAALDDITTGVRESMKNSSTAYTDEQYLPVLAIVEDGDGPIVIGNKRYQPIGVLPRTELDSRAGQIRQLAIEQPNKIISAGNRKVTSSVIVASPPLNISTSKETDKDFASLISEDLSPEDRIIIEDTTQDPIKRSAAYNKYVRKVASRLFAKEDKAGKPTLYYRLPTMKGDKSVSEIPVLTKTLVETTSPRNGKSLAEVLSIGNATDIVYFNSRTRDFIRVLNNLVKNNDLAELTSDGTSFTGESKALSIIEGINNMLRRYIYSTSFEYSIRPANVDGNLGLNLYLGDENLGRIVNSVTEKEVTAENMAAILSNLLMPSGSFRQGINWQVDKDPSYYTPNTKHYKEENVTNLIYDNILRVGIDRLERVISGVEVSSPVALREPVPANPTTTVVNADNSTSASSQDTGTATTQSGEKVDTDTGLTEQGKEVRNEITTAMEEAQKVSEKIEADSREIQLSEDGLTYVNTKTGKTYARVTSIIQADEEVGKGEVLTDSSGKPITLYRGYSLEREAEDIDETVQGRARDYVEGVGAKYHFTIDKEEAEGYAGVHSDADKKPAQVSSYYISNKAKIVEFEDLHDFDRNKKNRAKEIEEADVILLKQGTLTIGASEYIVKDGRKNVIIRTDKLGKFDPNSPWVTPSTNIGTGIDEFVRDFFNGLITSSPEGWLKDGRSVEMLYPNTSKEALNRFAEQLQKFKNYLDAQGLTVIPRDVVATGTLQVTDSNGGVHEIAVAGTLDLLAYDREGNFYIFDMKTHRAKNISEEKAAKYSKQLSLYKQFLEGKYGIKVKSLNIIPIHVEYPAPNNNNTYSVAEGNQLLLNGKEYKQANPILGEVGQISESPISIQYDKLSASEKALIGEITPTESKVKSAETKPEPQVKRDGELTVGKVKTKRKPIVKKAGAKPIKVESNPIGISFSSLSSEQQEALRTKYSEVIDIEEFFNNSFTEQEKQHELDCLG